MDIRMPRVAIIGLGLIGGALGLAIKASKQKDLEVVGADTYRRARKDAEKVKAVDETHGDARRAVDLLRVAAEIAERKSADALGEEHIRLALQHIEQDRTGEAVHSLPLHAKLLLTTIMLNHDTRSTGEIYESYRGLTETIRTEPLTQRRVSGLLAELDMLGLITTNVISKGRYGRTKSIHTQIPKSRLRDLLSDDPMLKDVKIKY